MADLVVTPSNVLASPTAVVREGVAGVTITAGQTLYRNDQQNNRLYLADCDASPQTANVVGVALHGASPGQPVKYAESDDSFTPGGTLTLGTVYVLSGTPGAIAPVGDLAAGDYLTVLFVPRTATTARLMINPSGAQVPSSG